MKGIYSIENIKTKRCYIGISNNLKVRFYTHYSKLNRNIHNNQHLQQAWNKYGKNNFRIKILIYSDNIDMLVLEKIEKELIKYYMSNVGVYNKTIGHGYYTNQKDNKKFIDSCKRNVKIMHEKIKVKVKAIDKKTKKEILFKSIKDAGKALNIDVGSISKIINNYKSFTSAKGYIFKKW